MAGVQNWSAKVIQLLPFKGALSVWFTCAHKHSHIHTHLLATCVFYIHMVREWKKCVAPKWRLKGHGVWPGVTALKWRHKSIGYSPYTHGLGREVRWRRVVRVEGGDWRIEEGGGGGEAGCKGHKVTMWGSVCCVSPCVFAVGRRELDMFENLKLQAVFALFFFSYSLSDVNTESRPAAICAQTWAHVQAHTCIHLVTHLEPKGQRPHFSGSQFLFTFCHASTRPLSTFELLPNASTQNPLFILKSLIDPQYWLVSLSLLESKYFMYNWPVNRFTLNSLRWQIIFYLCVLSKLQHLIFCYGRI